MKCNCLKEFENLIKERGHENKKVLTAEIQSLLTFGKKVERFSCSTLTLQVEGRKSKIQIEVKHSFCPFCGIKTEEEEKPASAPQPVACKKCGTERIGEEYCPKCGSPEFEIIAM